MDDISKFVVSIALVAEPEATFIFSVKVECQLKFQVPCTYLVSNDTVAFRHVETLFVQGRNLVPSRLVIG